MAVAVTATPPRHTPPAVVGAISNDTDLGLSPVVRSILARAASPGLNLGHRERWSDHPGRRARLHWAAPSFSALVRLARPLFRSSFCRSCPWCLAESSSSWPVLPLSRPSAGWGRRPSAPARVWVSGVPSALSPVLPFCPRPWPVSAVLSLSPHWRVRRQVDKSGSVAEKRTPEIPGGTGGRPAEAVSWATADSRAAWLPRRPRQAPMFAHVAASARSGRSRSGWAAIGPDAAGQAQRQDYSA